MHSVAGDVAAAAVVTSAWSSHSMSVDTHTQQVHSYLLSTLYLSSHHYNPSANFQSSSSSAALSSPAVSVSP